jgi:NAD(P)-dependent dehydrogenase (short-subunit alcohol dehydrogenase family)
MHQRELRNAVVNDIDRCVKVKKGLVDTMKHRKYRNRSSSQTGLWLAGLGIGLSVGTMLLRRQSRRMNFHNRVVVITGGSRGLGLEMARQFAAEGARLVLLARNEPELEMAYQELSQIGAKVMTIPCDVGIREQAEAAVDQVIERFGRLDVLINNAGITQVGPVDHMKVEDFEDAMNVHFWGPLYTMLKAIPVMRRQGGGRIVNVSSIGGKVSVPHLAPYGVSKYALVGLSDAYRAELARDDIAVTTVIPGLMRTGSYYHGNFKGKNEEEFTWFSWMAATPITAMHSSRAARQILNAVRFGVPQVTLTVQARLVEILNHVAPNLSAKVWETFARMLPEPTGDLGNELHTGFESRSKRSPSWVTQMADKAAERNNELLAERIR